MENIVFFSLLALAVPILLIVLSIVLFRAFTRKGGAEKTEKEVILEQKLDSIQKTLDTQVQQSTESVQKQMREQFEDSKKLIADITRELTEVKATGREMLSFTEQLQALERTLKNPQRRGAVGEYLLERVIANVLPPDSYATQYSFNNGVRADAVIFLQDKKLISIDAKFSLDNYIKLLEGEVEHPEKVERQLKEDLKMRIQETSKYIIPKEGTLDCAFMFIPSESLYYDLLTQKIGTGDAGESMLEYAFNKYKVVIVSPTTLLAYLQTVYFGLRSFKVEKHAQEIMKQVTTLKKHLDNYSKGFHSVGKALSTAVNHYNTAEQQYELIDRDVFKITGEGGEYSRETLDRPHSEKKE